VPGEIELNRKISVSQTCLSTSPTLLTQKTRIEKMFSLGIQAT
jgi:hypothetical protein